MSIAHSASRPGGERDEPAQEVCRLAKTSTLLAFCFAANSGSAGTLIGSPQNMITAEGLDLSFNGFMAVAGLPALASLPIVWGLVALIYRGRWNLSQAELDAGRAARSAGTVEAPALNRVETGKAALVTVLVVAAFVFSDWQRDLIALGAAGFLLLSRRISSSDMLRHVDGDLLLLIMGLFVVNAVLAATARPASTSMSR